jgi:biopolymer transport protein ExbD
MRVPSQLHSGEVGINMTPMIDVVFQLIIFFLLSGHLARQEVHLELPLPTAGSGESPAEENKARLTVNVLGDGRLLLASRPVTPDELQLRLAQERAAAGADLEVRIRSDRAAPYALIEPVLLSAARAGLWNVSFSVYRKEEAR